MFKTFIARKECVCLKTGLALELKENANNIVVMNSDGSRNQRIIPNSGDNETGFREIEILGYLKFQNREVLDS